MANAQVGIGTTSPNAQLDIESTTNGILIPRVALTSKATNVPVVNPNGGGVPADATLVYNTANSGSGGDAVVPGYYYYNAASSRWIQLSTALALTDSATNTISGTEIQRTALTGDITAAANSNATTISPDAVTSPKILDNTIVNADLTDGTGGIYKGSGTLPGDVVVTMPLTGSINFKKPGATTDPGLQNHFRVDGATFSVNTNDRRVGIGTTAPLYKLHVIGDTNIKGELRFESLSTDEYVGFINGGTAGGDNTTFIIQSARGGTGAGIVFNTNNGSSIIEAGRITNVGRFGLGLNNPQHKLDVLGDANVQGLFYLESPTNGERAGFLSATDEAIAAQTKLVIQSTRGGGGILFNTNNGSADIEAARITSDGQLGLGITAPTSTFHNNGTTSFTTSTSGTNTTVLLRTTNVTLPTAAAGNNGRMYIIRNTNATGTNISVSTIINYGATIAAAFTLTPAIGSITVISNGANWYRIE